MQITTQQNSTSTTTFLIEAQSRSTSKHYITACNKAPVSAPKQTSKGNETAKTRKIYPSATCSPKPTLPYVSSLPNPLKKEPDYHHNTFPLPSLHRSSIIYSMCGLAFSRHCNSPLVQTIPSTKEGEPRTRVCIESPQNVFSYTINN